MKQNASWWRVRGRNIVDERGAPVRLRGVCLGGWLSMENSITGYPGNESGQRQAVGRVLGEGKGRFFFERFLDNFITEADLRYIATLGATAVRVALNYRHFVQDERLSEYSTNVFARLDRLIAWSTRCGLHVILDLHALPGYQNPGWHSDNPGRRALFWGYSTFEDLGIEVWQELVTRYKGEPAVAGYNLMNEPVASQSELPWLHHYYRRATAAIRAIDRDHIVFLDGNHYAQRCDELEPPFDDNTVYSYHFYPEPVLETGRYPATLKGKSYGSKWLELVLLDRSRFMRTHGVPAWAGEFGVIFNGKAEDEASLRALADMLTIMNREGHHWTLWHYKDIGPMGVMNVAPGSEWMERTKPVRELKTRLRCDYWIERKETSISRHIDRLVRMIGSELGAQAGDQEMLADDLFGSICQETLSQLLLPAFAEQFRDMTESEIERMMQAFSFENCVPRPGLSEVLRGACD